MSLLLNRTIVSKVATSEPLTLHPTTKIKMVAKIFAEHRIDAAPVVDSIGKCIGILTTNDIRRFRLQEPLLNQQFPLGIAFDLVQITDLDPFEMRGRPFDDVAYNMSRELRTISGDSPLGEAADIMSQQEIHHLLLLDDAGRPVGIISSDDILKEVIGDARTFIGPSARMAPLGYRSAFRRGTIQ